MNRIEYDELVELYVTLEEELDDVLKVKQQHLMDTPEYVKIYRLILGYSAEDFAYECKVDTKVLRDIENGKQIEHNIINKIYDAIYRSINTNNIKKVSVELLSKNYLTIELIKSKNISILAKRQVKHLFFSKITKYWLIIIYGLFLMWIAYSNNIISLYLLIPIVVVVIYGILCTIYYKKQFFLWDNDIISNFIYLLLKDSFLESKNEISKIMMYLASRLDEYSIKYSDPDWYFDSIRNELAQTIRYNVSPNLNDTNKDEISNHFEKISIFLSTYSIDQYESIKKLIDEINTDFEEKIPQEKTIIERSIHIFDSYIVSPIKNITMNITNVVVNNYDFLVIGLISSIIIYYYTKNLEFTGSVLIFLAALLRRGDVKKPN